MNGFELRDLPRSADEMRARDAAGLIEVRTVALTQARAEPDEDGQVRAGGLAVVYDSPSVDMGGWYEVIERGALRKLLATKPDVRLLANHDGLPMARTASGTLTLADKAKGLEWSADLPDTTLGRDVGVLMGRGDLSQMSFAFRVAPEGGAVWDTDADGRERRTVREFAALPEVSIVTFPAYQSSTAGLRHDDAADDHAASPEVGEREQHDRPEAHDDAPADQGARSEESPDDEDANAGVTGTDAGAAKRRLDNARRALALHAL